MKRFLLAVIAACAASSGAAAAPDLGSDAQREEGRKLYDKLCAQCHGEKGDGAGPAAIHLRPAPRNFTSGKFKIRTTPNGALPTHTDLQNIIRRGMPYSSMPAWPELKDEELSNLAYYIKTFSTDFANPENVTEPAALPAGPAADDKALERGRTVFVEAGCVRCHGDLGRGDGPSAPTLKDDWGHSIRPADLTH